jgi:hypothetical protein
MRKFTIRRKSPYGFGTGSATTAGCVSTFARNGSSGTYAAWPSLVPSMQRANAAFTTDWMSGTLRKLTVRWTTSAPAATSWPLHGLVERHVGAPEAVDRLLRVADEEELRRRRAHAPPIALARSSAARRSSSSTCSGSVSWNSST